MDSQNNLCVQHLLGSPCKIQKEGVEILGRYIGDSNIPSSKCNIILVGTPCNSIFHVDESYTCFDLTRSDLNTLKDFEEDAVSRGEWYHTKQDNGFLSKIGTFIAPSDITSLMLQDD